MKIKNIILTLGLFLGVTSSSFAQVNDTVLVDLTVNAGVSSITINEASVGFGAQTPAENATRFESANVTGSYFAANGPWEVRVYTTNAGDVAGLIGTDANNSGASIPLFKVDPGADGDVTVPEDWSGTINPHFFFVLDDGAVDAGGNPFYAKVASSAAQDLPDNDNLLFNFGIDIIGAAQGAYSTTVTVELAVL